MPLQATSGAASYDAFGGGVAAVPNYIEDVFSTWLYTGNGSTQTITNGIDESGKGAMTWIKCRSTAYGHRVNDTTRGASKFLATNSTAAEDTNASVLTAFTSSGFSVGASTAVNENAATYASWTFRKQPKFFDVVTWTGDDAVGRQISHSLGSVPGCIIIKKTNIANEWQIFHRGLTDGITGSRLLFTTASAVNGLAGSVISAVSSTSITVGSSTGLINNSGDTYVAYLFAHDAGGFGLTGTDNVISCSSFVSGGTTTTNEINLGYEPQWVMIKPTTDNGSYTEWRMYDVMRGASETGAKILQANNSRVEATDDPILTATSTGFKIKFDGANMSGITFIYIAIRRGPMKVPTVGTSVYNAISRTGTGATANVTGVGFPPDMLLDTMRSTNWKRSMWDRLRGPNLRIATNQTSAETSYTDAVMAYGQDGVTLGADGNVDVNGSGYTYINWFFRRAPSFFDEVCAQGNYNGLSTPGTPHNLGVKPELVIQKSRNNATTWNVVDWNPSSQRRLVLNTTAASDDISADLPQATSSVFYSYFNSTHNCVNYLFASCPGVSKVFSYTGNGSSQTINCGFTGGARFVLIKRTDSTGDWYVWDSARGIVSGNDPHLSLNTTAAEVTTNDTIDTDSTGFVVNQVSATNVNVSSATYIGLAIA